MQNYSRAAKRRAKADMPELADAPKREANGRAQRATTRSERNADRANLEARARQMGLPASYAKDMKRNRLSEQAGMAIDILCYPDDANRLWAHYCALTGAEGRYHRTNGQSLYASTAKIEMEPERFETRADDVIDLRTEEERDKDAIRAWGRWCKVIDCLPLRCRSAITTAKRDWAALVDAGQITPAGRRFVDAMERLDAMM